MATRILDLPLLSFSMTVGTNEDWLDSWAYLDALGIAIPLDGMTFALMVRPTPSDPNPLIVASTGQVPVRGLQANGAVTAGGNALAVSVPYTWMQKTVAGAYVFEVQAYGDGVTRVVARGALTVVQGIVR